MANLKEIRVRMQSVKSTRQITSAMKMVSAAKLRKAQDAILQIRPYARKMQEILNNLALATNDEDNSIYSVQREIKKVLFVVITSNRGLCGAFNSNVVKKAVQQIDENFTDLFVKGNVDIIAIGKKGTDLLKTRKKPVIQIYHNLFDSLNFKTVEPVVSEIMENFCKGNYDRVFLVYNQFRNAAAQILVSEQFLPIKPVEITEDRFERKADYIFEPTKERIINEIIPKSLKIQFYKALLDSFASEHGARMTAMHKATDNATDLIRDLNLTYNKARQTTITKEINEIVGGAEALKG